MAEADKLVGLWALVEAHRTEPDGSVTPNYGDNPVGRILYTSDGFMSGHIRGAGDGADAPDSVVAYCGQWRLEGDCVVHEVLIGSNYVASNSIVSRRVSWDDGELLLTVEGWRPGETEGSRILRWRRTDGI